MLTFVRSVRYTSLRQPLHAFYIQTRVSDKRAVLEREWRKVVLAASTRPEWPKQQTLKLIVNSSQSGSRVGILLWKKNYRRTAPNEKLY